MGYINKNTASSVIRVNCKAVIDEETYMHPNGVEDQRVINAILLCNKKIQAALFDLPDEDVRVNVRGKWEKHITRKYDTWGDEVVTVRKKCSECGRIKNTPEGWNFCPFCGADMRRERQ